MIIRKTINDERWDIEIKSDYKHKSDPITPLEFYESLVNVREIIFPDNVLNPPEHVDSFSVSVTIMDGGPIIPEYMMTEITRLFASNPTYPINIKMTSERNIKIKIHVRKDGCMTISRYFPKGITFKEQKASSSHDNRWL